MHEVEIEIVRTGDESIVMCLCCELQTEVFICFILLLQVYAGLKMWFIVLKNIVYRELQSLSKSNILKICYIDEIIF